MSDVDRRLQILLADYQMAREEERAFVAAEATAFGVAVALTAGVAALTTQTCQLQPDKGRKHNCVDAPQALLAAVPLGPFALLAFVAVLGTVATIRSYYLRGLEAELRKFITKPFELWPGVFPGSYSEFVLELTSLRRGRLGYRILNFSVLAATLVIFGGFTVYIALHVDSSFQIAMGVVYGCAGAILVNEALAGTVGGRRMFERVARRFAHRPPSHGLPDLRRSPTAQRSLISYLIVPRPEDITKTLFFPLTFIISVWAVGGIGGHELARAALVWVALEFFLYYARYQWNDVRGIETDSVHSDFESRARLPIGSSDADTRRNIWISLIVGVLRILAAGAIAWLVGFETLGPIAILAVAVFGLAIVYEWVKGRIGLEGERRADAAPASRPSTAVGTLWVLVGGGYAIRGVAGMVLAGIPLGSFTALLAIPAFVGFGTAFVTLTWVLEALSHCRATEKARRSTRPQIEFGGDLTRKPHLLDLLRYINVEAQFSADPAGKSCRDLRGADEPSSWWAPWNVAYATSVVVGGALAMRLAGVTSAGAQVLAALASAVGVWFFVSGRARKRFWVTLIWAVVLVIIAVAAEAPQPLLGAGPWLAFSGVVHGFRSANYAALKFPAAKIAGVVKSATQMLARLIVGTETARYLDRQRTPQG